MRDQASRRRLTGCAARRRALWRLVGMVLLGLLLGGVAHAGMIPLQPTAHAAPAAPGQPGTPGDPAVVFAETFERGQSAQVTSLANYVGVAGQSHTADPFWLNTTECNGVLVEYAEPVFPANWCFSAVLDKNTQNARNNVRRLADVLGQVGAGAAGGTTSAPQNASTDATQRNHAVTAWTLSQAGPAGGVQFATSPIALAAASGRFVAASVDVAETSCSYLGGINNSRLDVEIIAGGTTFPLTNDPIRACTDPRVRYYTSPDLDGGWYSGGAYVAAGRFPTDAAHLLSPQDVGAVQVVMRNESGATDGNDSAFDNIRLLDVTPQLDKSFSPARVPAGGVTTLTFTVTNTSDLAAKSGWSFTDALPDGLVVADPARIGGSCDASVTATPGSSQIAVAGGNLETDQASCTVTVDVTAPGPGTYTNGPQNVVVHGLNPPGTATVDFVANYSVTKTATVNGSAPAGGAVKVGDVITYTVTATSASGAVPGLSLSDDLSDVLDNATFVSGSASLKVGSAVTRLPDPTGATLVVPPFTLPGGGTATLSYQVKVKADAWLATLKNVVTPSGPLPPDECSCTTTNRTGASIAIQKNGSTASGLVTGVSGAAFRVLADDSGKPGAPLADRPVQPVAGEAGRYRVADLMPGTYWLDETVAPDGYLLLAAPVAFRIGADGAVTMVDPAISPNVTIVDGVLTVLDERVVMLPFAGGSGSAAVLGVGGGLLAAAAVGWVVLRARRGDQASA